MQTGDSGSGVAQASGELDLGSLGRALWSKKGWIIGLTLAAAVIAAIGVNLVTPQIPLRSARADRDPGQHLPAARRRKECHGARRDRRSGSGHEPGPTHPFARSRARSDQEAQAQRTSGVRSGAAWSVVAAQHCKHHRPHQGSDEHDAGGARAQELLRSPVGLSGREVARDRDRVRVAECRAGGARRQYHRRALHRPATVREAGSNSQRRHVARRRNREFAQEGRGGRSQSREVSRQHQSVHGHEQHDAVEPAAR